MPPDRGFELVIFDCDGVLIDSEIISSTILISQLADAGVDVDFQYFQRYFLGRSFPKVAESVRKTFDVTLPSDFEASYRRRLFDAFSTKLKATIGVSEVLENLSQVIRSRFRLRRKVVALSQEAKSSAAIIGALPILVGGGMNFMQPDYTGILFVEPVGKALLWACAIWMGIGVLVMRQMINFKV